MTLQDLSIINLLPPNLATDKNTRMALEAFDMGLRDSIAKIPSVLTIPNIDKIIDNLLLDLLAWQFHVDNYDVSYAVNVKQQLITKSLDWHSRKGLKDVVEEAVSLVIGDAQITEWFEDPDKLLMPYTFKIETGLSVDDVKTIENLYKNVFSMKNTRSWVSGITKIYEAITIYYMGIGILTEQTLHIINSITGRTEPAVQYAGQFNGFKQQAKIKPSSDVTFINSFNEGMFNAVTNGLVIQITIPKGD